MSIHPYFNLVGIEPGMVITFQFGAVDFRTDLPLHILKELYDSKFPYLKLTKQGIKAFTPIPAPAKIAFVNPLSEISQIPPDPTIPVSPQTSNPITIASIFKTKKRARKNK